MSKNSTKKVIEFRPRVVSDRPLCSTKELGEYKDMLTMIALAESELLRLNQIFAKRIKDGGHLLPAGYYFDEIMGLTPVKDEAVAAR